VEVKDSQDGAGRTVKPKSGAEDLQGGGVTKEHVQIINSSGQHSGINDKREEKMITLAVCSIPPPCKCELVKL